MNNIFDSHAHYDDPAFDKDREELLAGLNSCGIEKVMNVSANIKDIAGIAELVSRYDFMWMTTGVHPSETYELGTEKCVVPMLPETAKQSNPKGKNKNLSENLDKTYTSAFQSKPAADSAADTGLTETISMNHAQAKVGISADTGITKKTTMNQTPAKVGISADTGLTKKPTMNQTPAKVGISAGTGFTETTSMNQTQTMVSLTAEHLVDQYIEASLKLPKVRAIGEIGLDYHYDDTDKKCQQHWFVKQIELAKKHGLPIVIHSREAAADTLDILKQTHADEVGGVMHCFSYEPEMAKLFMDLGFYIGVGGVVTFKNARKLKEIVQYMPMDMMLIETDCPYLAPTPHRGERNDSRMLTYVVEEISRLKNIPAEEVCRITNENACKMYRIQ